MMGREKQTTKTMQHLGIQNNHLAVAFPEFETIKNQFIYGEVRRQGELNEKLQMLVVIAALITVEGEDLSEQINAALQVDVSPIELQEVFHQVAPYIGFAKAEKGLSVLKKVFETREITLPLEKQSTVTDDTRLENGINVQKTLFGPVIDNMRANAPEDQRFLQDYLSAYCFGDTYTRGGLDIKTRELLTFVCIISLGCCENQAKAHVGGNMTIGNGPSELLAAVTQCLPYIGFPKTLNAVSAINEIMKMKNKTE